MAVGFGFSVGDFLTTLDLVATIVDALRLASQSSSAFRGLLNELLALERALIQVKSVDLNDSQQQIALYQAASQCQRSIDAFWNKIQKYQPHFSQTTTTTSSVKDGWMKIKWAVCDKKEIDGFRAEIQAHTGSILVLLGAVQVNATAKQARDQETQYKSLSGTIQSFAMQAMGKLSAIASTVSKTASQSADLVQTCARILETNVRVFQIVYDIQLFITKLPGQVQRQQPVYFVDALNRETPFHLEFVRSAEALLAILKVNLKETGYGPKLIDKGDFVIEESGTNRVIDITQNWDMCFFPGQRAAMSMVFRERTLARTRSKCPKCGDFSDKSSRQDVTCNGDELRRRSRERRPERTARGADDDNDGNNDDDDEDHDNNDEAAMRMFRRLQIVAVMTQGYPTRMAKPLPVLASVAGIATAGGHIAEALFEIANAIRHAPKEVSEMAVEISLLSSVLQDLRNALASCYEVCKPRLLKDIERTVKKIEELHRQIRDLVKNTTSSRYRLGLLFKGAKTKDLLAQIEGHISSVNIMLTVIQLAATKRQLSLSNTTASKTNTGEIRELIDNILHANEDSIKRIQWKQENPISPHISSRNGSRNGSVDRSRARSRTDVPSVPFEDHYLGSDEENVGVD